MTLIFCNIVECHKTHLFFNIGLLWIISTGYPASGDWMIKYDELRESINSLFIHLCISYLYIYVFPIYTFRGNICLEYDFLRGSNNTVALKTLCPVCISPPTLSTGPSPYLAISILSTSPCRYPYYPYYQHVHIHI